MVSNDAALRIKAAHLGVGAAEHQPTKRVRSERPMGWCVIATSYEVIDCLYAAGAVDVAAVLGTVDGARDVADRERVRGAALGIAVGAHAADR